MKRYKLSKHMLENYSVVDLENYLKKHNQMPLYKKQVIKKRIEELKKENEKFIRELQISSLFKLAGCLLASQRDLKKIFMLSYEEAKEKELKLFKRHLKKAEYNRRNKEMSKYINNIKGKPYIKIDSSYIITHPIIFDIMLAIVNEAHNKGLHSLINGKEI